MSQKALIADALTKLADPAGPVVLDTEEALVLSVYLAALSRRDGSGSIEAVEQAKREAWRGRISQSEIDAALAAAERAA